MLEFTVSGPKGDSFGRDGIRTPILSGYNGGERGARDSLSLLLPFDTCSDGFDGGFNSGLDELRL